MVARVGQVKLQNLLRCYSVFHWIGNVDEAHYMGFMGELKGSIQENGWPKKVVLHVNNSGGDLDVAGAFYDYVRASGLHLVTIASGDVASAAVVLFLSGKERYASQFSSFLIHDPTIEVHSEITIRNVEQPNLHVASMHKRYLALLSQASGISEEEIDRISEGALPFSADRARELGIAHDIF